MVCSISPFSCNLFIVQVSRSQPYDHVEDICLPLSLSLASRKKKKEQKNIEERKYTRSVRRVYKKHDINVDFVTKRVPVNTSSCSSNYVHLLVQQHEYAEDLIALSLQRNPCLSRTLSFCRKQMTKSPATCDPQPATTINHQPTAHEPTVSPARGDDSSHHVEKYSLHPE